MSVSDKTIYFTLLSSASLAHFPANTASKFCVQLSKEYHFPAGQTYVGLAELSLPVTTASDSDLFVYSDVSAFCAVGDTESRLLRHIRLSKGVQRLEFAHIFFHTLDKNHFDTITVYLADENGAPFFTPGGGVLPLPTTLVLCIKTTTS